MFKILDEVCTPTKGSKYSAAIDLYAREDVVIGAGETAKVPLGICIDINIDWYMGNKINKNPSYGQGVIDSFEDFIKSHYMQLEPRSSLRAKGLIAGTGIIDIDYKDEIKIILHKPINKGDDFETSGHLIGFNDEDFGYKVKKGDKIAQILLKEHKTYLMGFDTQEERNGGFGSTGK